MKLLPSRPDIDQLKRQAKDLLAGCRRGDPSALERLRAALPAMAGRDREASPRLHDAQSCLAREYGFVSWADLKAFVQARRLQASEPAALAAVLAGLVYSGDIAGGMNRARPEVAARLLRDNPGLPEQSPWIACAAGEVAIVRGQIRADATWLNRPGGPLDLPPLVAVTHSSLLRLDDYRQRLHATADLLIESGADPNQSVGSRWPPASLDNPSREHRLSALYGAAGQNHDPELTRRLLLAGADPNDGESLYHSLEAPACTRLLLQAGAIVTGTNALYRVLDFDDLDTLQLLLSHAADAPELSAGRLLAWAIRRRRSPGHIEALIQAGVDPSATARDGAGAYTMALHYGLPQVAEMLRDAGAAEALPDEELFVAACARADADAARRIQSARPDLPEGLGESRLRLLPELAAAGCAGPVRLMIELGWPVDIRGGDWGASALNHAVFRGDGQLARFLLDHGASWTEDHGYGDNVCGTLSWASLNHPIEGGDWLACAEALLASGMPPASGDADDPDGVIVDGARRRFSDEVTALLLGDGGDASG